MVTGASADITFSIGMRVTVTGSFPKPTLLAWKLKVASPVKVEVEADHSGRP